MKEKTEENISKYLNTKKTNIILLFTSIALVLFMYKCIKWLNTDSNPPQVYYTSITNGNDSIYITYNVGGFLGDVHDVIISQKKMDKKYVHYNEDSVYIIKDALPIFYKYIDSTLFLYLFDTIAKPKYFNSSIDIVIFDISEGNKYLKLKNEYEKSLKKLELRNDKLIMP